MHLHVRSVCLGLATLVAAASTVTERGSAQRTQLIIPSALADGVTEGSSATTRPWSLGNVGNGIRVQNVYDTSHFVSGTAPVSGPIVIESLRWRADGGAVSAGGTYADVSIVIGLAGVNHMQARQVFDANFMGGVRPLPSYRGPVVLRATDGRSPGAFYIDVVLQTPFVYDPTQGDDLIIEMQHDGVFVGDAAPSDATFLSQPSATTRIYSSTDPNRPTGTVQFNIGLACEVGYRPTGSLAANFRYAPLRVGPSEVVQFTDASVSTDPMGIQFWSWDFDGDGITDSTQQNPAMTAQRCGGGDVTLIVTDLSGSRVRTLPGPVVGPPVAAFDFAATPGTPLQLNFADRTTAAPTGWAWDFDGDGSVDSTAQNPTFTFAGPDRFEVELVVTNGCGSHRTTQVVDLRSTLTTTFAGGNSLAGRRGGAHYFDLTVQPSEGVTVTAIGVHGESAGAAAQIEVYLRPGSYVGQTDQRGAWTLASRGVGVVAGLGLATEIDIDDLALPVGSYGVCVVANFSAGDLIYSDGVGGGTTTFTSAGGELSLETGEVRDLPFAGSLFTPRSWNGFLAFERNTRRGAFSPVAVGCPGTARSLAPALRLVGPPPAIANAFSVELSGARANSAAFLMVGLIRAAPLDLGLIGMPGCPLWVRILDTSMLTLDSSGSARATFPINGRAGTAGLTFAFQGFIVDSGANAFGAVVSDAAVAIIGS